MASAVLAEPIELCWEPVVRRAMPEVVPASWEAVLPEPQVYRVASPRSWCEP